MRKGRETRKNIKILSKKRTVLFRIVFVIFILILILSILFFVSKFLIKDVSVFLDFISGEKRGILDRQEGEVLYANVDCTGLNLAECANSMQPGDWAELETNNIDPTLVASGASGYIFGYTESIKWDPTSQKLFFIGADHGDSQHFAVYNAVTNTWSRQDSGAPLLGPTNHGYDHMAVDPIRHYFYSRHGYYGNYLDRYNTVSGTWSATPVNNNLDYAQCCGGIDYFPELDGVVWFQGDGAGSVGMGELYIYKESTNSWQELGTNLLAGSYSNFLEYNPVKKAAIFGGGGGNRNLYSVNSSGYVRSLSNSPMNLGIQDSIVTADTVSGDYLILTSAHQFWRYDITSDTWTRLTAAEADIPSYLWPSSGSVHGMVGGPISTYGVNVYVSCDAGPDCRVHLYKHSSSNPDTINPSVSITSPSNGAIINGEVTISATASDNVGVTQVDFRVDGGSVGIDTSLPYNLLWNTGGVANGSHSISAIARDAAGNTNTSTINVNVQNAVDTTPPTIPTNLRNTSVSTSTVSLSWDASSDDTGVVGYRIYRNNLQIGISAGTNYPDNSVSANATYSYKVSAYDAAGNPSGNSSVLVVTTPAASGGSDFTTRCAMPGVVRCVGFDSQNELYIEPWSGPGYSYGDPYGIFPGASTPGLDSSVKSSGASSLLFTIPPYSPADTSGSFFVNFADNLSVQFGVGEEFYVQWRQRFSPEYLSTHYLGGGGQKLSIIGEGDRSGYVATSCTDLEIVTNNNLYRGFPQMYHSCGAKDGQYEPLDQPYGGYDFKLENAMGDPYCLYTEVGNPSNNCSNFKANQWMTFQVHVKIGTPYTDGPYMHDSTIELWVAEEGKPSQLALSYKPNPSPDACHQANPGTSIPSCNTGYDLFNNNPSVMKYGKVWLLPYNTGKSESENHPTAYTWYDELIISRNKIADPGISGEGDTTSPVRSNGKPSGNLAAGTTSANINLTTDESATCRYSTTAGTDYASMVNTFTTTGETYHAVQVSGLTNGTFNYYVKCIDTSGNFNTNDYLINFIILSDTTPPIISNIVNSSITNNSATISWNTNENANGTVEYGITTSLGSAVLHSNYLIAHSLQLINLAGNMTYYYRVKSCDSSGNCANSTLNNFRTLPNPIPPCNIINASWSLSNVVQGQNVNLIVNGENCNGQSVNFSVWEDDTAADDPANINPVNVSFIGNTATVTWTAEWQCDGNIGGLCTLGLPEYYFVATLVGNSSVNRQSNAPLLVVSELSPTCGNNLTQGGEECDDGNTNNNDACLNICADASCGDGYIWIGGEECDGSNLGGESCISLGYDGGDLSCLTGCGGFDVSQCTFTDKKQVILISIDGLQSNHFYSMLNSGQLPNFTSMIQGGFNGTMNITHHSYTSTAPGHAELLSGFGDDITGVSDNSGTNLPDGLSVFERVELGDSSIVTGSIWGKNTTYVPTPLLFNARTDIDWYHDFSTWNEVLYLGNPNYATANSVANKSKEFLDSYYNQSFILFVHFEEPDAAGHASGENSANYDQAIRDVDNGLGIILSKLKSLGIYENVRIIVGADHGFIEGSTGHTPATPDTIVLPLLSNNATLLRSSTPNGLREQCEVVPTILDYFGFNYSDLVSYGCNSMMNNSAFCGNGFVESGEFCDDGILNGKPSMCNASCSGYTSISTTSMSLSPPRVGTHSVNELSGIVASRQYKNVYWTMGDSGNAASIYAINESGTLLGSYSVSGVSNRDWEDIALDENNRIFIAETGDNSQVHPAYYYYVVAEPNPYSSGSATPTTYTFLYGDGEKKDSEGTFIWQNLPYAVQKRPSNAEIFHISSLQTGVTLYSNRIGEFNNNNNMITGADISRDGRRLALIHDGSDYHWIIERNADSTNVSDFFTKPMNIWRIQFTNGYGEAITFVNGTYDFVVASEDWNIWRINQAQYDTIAACVGEEEITSMCKCGMGNFVYGYCCSGNWQDVSCSASVCGNNVREGIEVCDGTDLASQSCLSLGYNEGELACLGSCSGFNTSNCFSNLIQQKTSEHAYGGTPTSLDIILDSFPIAGNLLISAISSDKSAGTYTAPNGFTIINQYYGASVSGALAYKISNGTEREISWQYLNGEESAGWYGEFTGFATSGVLDTNANANSGEATVSSQTTGTTSMTLQADELAIAMYAIDSAQNLGTASWNNGFTGIASAGTGGVSGLKVSMRTFNNTGSQETTFSYTGGTADQSYAAIATFKLYSGENCIDGDGEGYNITGSICGAVDCNDTNSGIYPGAVEICDGIDQNCNGLGDEPYSVYYRDADLDGFGNAVNTTLACSAPVGYIADNTDCDDMDALERPGQTWYADIDNDGYSSGATLTLCLRPIGHKVSSELTAINGDCNDTNSLRNPGMADNLCDGIDNNCNGVADEGYINTTTTCGVGQCVGNTGVLACISGTQIDTCNPLEGATAESCVDNSAYDGLDNNCDGNIDLDCDSYCDEDGDTYSSHIICALTGYSLGDCNDTSSLINPGRNDTCNDIDDDCNAGTADGTSEIWYNTTTNCGIGECANSGVLTCLAGIQTDTCSAGTPISEICDGLDNNCDNTADNSGNALCNNGLYCDGTEVCNGVLGCQLGTSPNLNDGVVCTIDTCDEANDNIVHTPNNALCSDSNACNGIETCSVISGCLSGAPVDCSLLDDQCNLGTCVPGTGSCVQQPANEAGSCDNSLFCTTGEVCSSGICTNGVVTCAANESCNEGTDMCIPIPGWCDDSADCNDGNQCTTDICVSNSCVIANVAIGTECHDGQYCTVEETCNAGICGSGISRDCSAYNGNCLVGICDEGADSCIGQQAANGVSCNDTLSCTENDICSSGICSGTSVNVDDGISCTVDSCAEIGGVSHAATDSLCNDGLFCTGNEICNQLTGCVAGTDPCNLGEYCNEGAGICSLVLTPTIIISSPSIGQIINLSRNVTVEFSVYNFTIGGIEQDHVKFNLDGSNYDFYNGNSSAVYLNGNLTNKASWLNGESLMFYNITDGNRSLNAVLIYANGTELGNTEARDSINFIVNITQVIMGYCGDGICNATIGEDCSSCNTDCGTCPSDDGGSPSGGGGSIIIKPKPKVTNVTNISETDENIDKIELEEESVNVVDVDIADNVIIDLNDILYEASFILTDEGVILKVANGEFLIKKEDILPVLIGGQEMYVGAASIDGTKAAIVLGLDKQKVQERIGLTGEIIEDKNDKTDLKKFKNLPYFAAIGIISISIIFIGWYLTRILLRNIREKRILERFGEEGVNIRN